MGSGQKKLLLLETNHYNRSIACQSSNSFSRQNERLASATRPTPRDSRKERCLTLLADWRYIHRHNQVQALDLGSSPAAMQLLDTSETQRQRLMQTKKGCVCQKLKWFSKTKPTPSQNDPPTRNRVNKGRSHMFFVPQPKRLAC